MEKYGAEVERYEVYRIFPSTPDDRELVGENMTLDEANDLAKKTNNSIVVPARHS